MTRPFKFLDDVLTEVFQLFPGKYVHIGGDEVPKDTWKNNPACQALMKREGLKTRRSCKAGSSGASRNLSTPTAKR